MHLGNLRAMSSGGYGVAMVATLAFFALQAPALVQTAAFWIAGITSALAAFVLGWWLGGWYVPVGHERPRFELVACPLLVFVLSVAVGLGAFWCFAVIVNANEPRPLMGLVAVLGFGYANLLAQAWPAVVVSFGGVATWLAWRSTFLPSAAVT